MVIFEYRPFTPYNSCVIMLYMYTYYIWIIHGFYIYPKTFTLFFSTIT
jgi:hypothetical protein